VPLQPSNPPSKFQRMPQNAVGPCQRTTTDTTQYRKLPCGQDSLHDSILVEPQRSTALTLQSCKHPNTTCDNCRVGWPSKPRGKATGSFGSRQHCGDGNSTLVDWVGNATHTGSIFCSLKIEYYLPWWFWIC
jgi:hypothetical protein